MYFPIGVEGETTNEERGKAAHFQNKNDFKAILQS